MDAAGCAVDHLRSPRLRSSSAWTGSPGASASLRVLVPAAAAAAAVFVIGVALGDSSAAMFAVAVALAVSSAVPEGLPVVFTVALASGVVSLCDHPAVPRSGALGTT